MQNIKTPGVYIQEISKLPASVAPVATAIPAFVGYTKKRVRNREDIPKNTPIQVASLLEYEEIFGGAFEEPYVVTLEPDADDSEETEISITPEENELSPYLMHHCLRLYFGNGGGKCWIVSVGDGYEDDLGNVEILKDDLVEGLDALAQEDEPTVLVVPEAVKLNDTHRKTLHDAMLGQCEMLKDRFALFDVLVEDNNNSDDDAEVFRDNEVGMEALKYGAAYYPSLKTTIRRSYNAADVTITDNRGGSGLGRFHERTLQTIADGITSKQGEVKILSLDDIEDQNVLTINGYSFTFFEQGAGDIEIEETQAAMRDEIAKVLNEFEDEGGNSIFNTETEAYSGKVIIDLAENVEDRSTLDISFEGNPDAIGITIRSIIQLEPDKTLYNRIASDLDKKRLTLYPSAAMAGVYARVDRNRGVWKAPANVSLNLVRKPSVILTDEEQAVLNVDASTGKSINAIRSFHGKGTIIWGARTLAGNDNEWRYIPVRRFFIFIEESIKKATEPVVFEPNNANTWARTRAMIENFLTGLWRDGALAGATPEEAFFVKVGLGETMSANDILEGRLIIDIGIAAVRPAEFIILQFMHKLQES